jgi:hypothetical protein
MNSPTGRCQHSPGKSKILGINRRLFQALKSLGLLSFDVSSPRHGQSAVKDYTIVGQLATQEYLRLSPELTRLYLLTITHVYRKLRAAYLVSLQDLFAYMPYYEFRLQNCISCSRCAIHF